MVNGGDDVELDIEEEQSGAAEAWHQPARIREGLSGGGAADGFVVGDILLPAMPAATMRSPGGRALVGLLRARDRH